MADDPKARGTESTEADVLRDRALGAAIITRLHGVLRGMRLYDAGNRALHGQLQELFDALHALQADEVSLLGMGEYFYVNGVRLRPDGSQVPVFRSVLGELESRKLSGLRFSSDLTIDELKSFLRLLHVTRTDNVAATLERECAMAGVRNACAIRAREVGTNAADEQSAPGDRDRQKPRQVFRRAISGTRDVMIRTARTGRPALQQARRVVQPIVDQLLRSEDSLVGLTALKNHDEYTYAHCVNVSILSIRMGQLLGLSRSDLAAVGVSGLLHDTGKIAVPAEVLRKPGQLDENEWKAIRRHPIEGMRIVSRLPSISELMLDAMRVAFEHHMNIDHTGYPGVRAPREMGAFSRIVAVADFFDAVTSHRAYRKRPMTAHEALRLMLGREAPHFDRAVLWALVQTVGLYPAGTLIQTDAGRLLVSVSPYSGDPRRPMVRELFAGPEGETVPAPVESDALLPEGERILHVLTPEEVDADLEMILAA